MTRSVWRASLAGGLVTALLTACAAPPPSASLAPSASSAAPSRQCTAPAVARGALAPGGTLRVGVYAGSPTSLVTDAQGARAGVAYELGQALGQWLCVPVQTVEFKRVAEVVDALKAGQVDFTVTNASPARARIVSFAQPLLSLELGYLVPAASPLRSIDEIDRAGMRVGVSEGSSSQSALGRQFRQASVVPVASLKLASEQLARGELQAFATNKGILNELADGLPGARILDGRWGLEHMAMAIPQGREAALPQLDAFARDLRSDGSLTAAVRRAGLRGTAEP